MAAVTENPPGQGERPDGAQPDPEQWRQFQEFQRFQEYLRFTESRTETRNTELATWQPTQVPVPDQPRSPVPYQPRGDESEAPTPPQGQRALQPAQPEWQQQLTGMQQQLTEISKTQQAAERRANPPLWRRLLRSKWLRLAIVALLLVSGVGSWLLAELLGNNSTARDDAAERTPLRRAEKSFLDPEDAVPFVYYGIAGLSQDRENVGGAERFCSRAFDSRAADQFARVVANTGDCPSAAIEISAAVRDPASYGAPNAPNMPAEQLSSGRTTVSSCALPISGGPRLGTFTLARYQDTGRWEIVAVAKEDNCP